MSRVNFRDSPVIVKYHNMSRESVSNMTLRVWLVRSELVCRVEKKSRLYTKLCFDGTNSLQLLRKIVSIHRKLYRLRRIDLLGRSRKGANICGENVRASL